MTEPKLTIKIKIKFRKKKINDKTAILSKGKGQSILIYKIGSGCINWCQRQLLLARIALFPESMFTNL